SLRRSSAKTPKKWPAVPSRFFRNGEILRPRIAFDSVRKASFGSSGRCESGSKSFQAIFKDTLKQLRGFAVADALRDEGSRPVDATPTSSRLIMHTDRGQIVGDREWRLNDGVAVASSSVVEFLEPFDDGLAVWGGYMPDPASLGRLAPWDVRRPIGQRIKATNQLPGFIRRNRQVDACGRLCHSEVLCYFTFSAAISSALILAPASATARSFSTVEPETPIAPLTSPLGDLMGTPP